ncbi:DNA-directed RNA polymerase sigma-70 factor [Dyadobacter beijingensis]|uniref:DNA-directed RNA polymerase sigma-70 factor n=1 Tax=Dyadobacter beijingensis TaxID=365489 RepID=A0ABQ2I000_9BACT|nr:RNA polymerase sigma-70 factor [Dyadobacter beijingensis]GGM96561.1 DNA-directed RNA polymerase sigma-70 factor [Dyadobacter beijingensis]
MTAFPLNDFDEDSPGRGQEHADGPVPAGMVADDEWLLRSQFSANPEKGCELLFRRYYVNLCNHAIRFVHSRAVAEDIVSEIFTTFWQNQTFLHVSTSYRAYLYKAVRHRAYNYLKWQMRFIAPADAPVHASESPSPDEALQYTELHQRIELIVRDLPAQCRRAYLLKRVEGKKYDEVAEEMNISAKAVEALVSRALSRIRKELSAHWVLFFTLFFC